MLFRSCYLRLEEEHNLRAEIAYDHGDNESELYEIQAAQKLVRDLRAYVRRSGVAIPADLAWEADDEDVDESDQEYSGGVVLEQRTLEPDFTPRGGWQAEETPVAKKSKGKSKRKKKSKRPLPQRTPSPLSERSDGDEVGKTPSGTAEALPGSGDDQQPDFDGDWMTVERGGKITISTTQVEKDAAQAADALVLLSKFSDSAENVEAPPDSAIAPPEESGEGQQSGFGGDSLIVERAATEATVSATSSELNAAEELLAEHSPVSAVPEQETVARVDSRSDVHPAVQQLIDEMPDRQPFGGELRLTQSLETTGSGAI